MKAKQGAAWLSASLSAVILVSCAGDGGEPSGGGDPRPEVRASVSASRDVEPVMPFKETPGKAVVFEATKPPAAVPKLRVTVVNESLFDLLDATITAEAGDEVYMAAGFAEKQGNSFLFGPAGGAHGRGGEVSTDVRRWERRTPRHVSLSVDPAAPSHLAVSVMASHPDGRKAVSFRRTYAVRRAGERIVLEPAPRPARRAAEGATSKEPPGSRP